MKNIYIVVLLATQCVFIQRSSAQNIAINEVGNLPDTSAMLDISSVTKGLLTPRMTTTQQNAIPVPAKGLLIFNLTDNEFKVNTGTSIAPIWTGLATGTGTIKSLNGLTQNIQTFATGTTGSDFNIASSGTIHTFNIPDASAANRGLVTNGLQTFGGNKIFNGTITAGNLMSGATTDSIVMADATGLLKKRTITSVIGQGAWATSGNSSINSGNNFLGTINNASLRIRTNNTERMVIDSLGKVGIGVSDPASSLVVKDNVEIRRTGSVGQLIFTNTAGSGDFRLGGDGGDIFWQGGGSRSLQMGSYWATILGGDRQTGVFPAFIGGISGTSVIVASQRDPSVALGIQGNSTNQSANLTEWRKYSGASVLDVIDVAGNLGLGIGTPLQKLHVNGQAIVSNLTSGVVADFIVTADSAGLLKRRTVASVMAGSSTNTLTSSTNTITSTVNGTVATSPIVNSNTLTLTGVNLVSSVNGIASPAIDMSSLTNDRWKLTGNTGTTPGANFLGTLDNVDFIFKTNNIEAMRLTGPGRLLGLNVSNPIYRIQVEDPGGPDADIATRMYNTSNQGYFPSMQLQVSAGTKSSPLPVTSGTILGALHFAGFDGSTFNDVVTTGIVSKTTQTWSTSGHGSYLIFKTIANNSTAESERMKIDHNGNVGIGTSSPGSILDVKGTIRLSGSSSGYIGFSPAAAAGSTTYTLPSADGTSGQLLTTSGSGILSWSSAPSTSNLVPYSGANTAVNLGTNNLTTTGTTATNGFTVTGNSTVGTNTTNTIILKGAIQGSSALVFDGATVGGNMTTFNIIDPTLNNIITVPNTTGTLMTKIIEDVNPQLGGNLMMNNNSIDITAGLATNQSYVGTFETAVVGENVVFGDVLYFDFSTTTWKKAKADAAVTTPAQRIAIQNIAANATGKLLIEGFVRNDAWSFSAAAIYLSQATAGANTTSKPTLPGNQVQRIGIATNTNKLHFRPSIDIISL